MRAFSPPLFPVDFRDVPGHVVFHDVPRRPWTAGTVSLAADLVLHPGPTVGFRIETGKSSIAYLPDHEPALTGIANRPTQWISGAALAHDADLLLHDAQYFESEYEERIGWGHSSVAHAVAYSHAVDARRLVLFHHDPTHSDGVLEQLQDRAANSTTATTLHRSWHARAWSSSWPRRQREHNGNGRPKSRIVAVVPLEEASMPRATNAEVGHADARGWVNVLADVPLFAGLSRRHLNKVASTGSLKRFHDNTAIVRAGEMGTSLYVVLDGTVRTATRVTVLRLGMGSVFGETALLDGHQRSATVMADEPVLCLTIEQSRFLRLLRSEPAIAIALSRSSPPVSAPCSRPRPSCHDSRLGRLRRAVRCSASAAGRSSPRPDPPRALQLARQSYGRDRDPLTTTNQRAGYANWVRPADSRVPQPEPRLCTPQAGNRNHQGECVSAWQVRLFETWPAARIS